MIQPLNFQSKKATQLCVAFFVFFMSVSSEALIKKTNKLSEKKNTNSAITEIQQKVTALLLQKQRTAALDLILQFEKSPAFNPDSKVQLLHLKESVATVFFSQDAQDLFEISTSQFLQSPRQSEKNIQKCLALEADNFFCRWHYLKILKTKNTPEYITQAQEFFDKYKDLPEHKMLIAYLIKDTEGFAWDKVSADSHFPLLSAVLEYERSIRSKNFALAKSALNSIKSQFPDYPETAFMDAQLQELSQETPAQNPKELIDLYKKNCSSLSTELTRKYYYDIDLCHRG